MVAIIRPPPSANGASVIDGGDANGAIIGVVAGDAKGENDFAKNDGDNGAAGYSDSYPQLTHKQNK